MLTIYLGDTFTVDQLKIFGGEDGGNAIPGAIESATVEVGDTTVHLTSTATTSTTDTFDLTDTPLAGLATDRIVVRNVTANFFGFPLDQFSIAEVTVDRAPVPPPTTSDLEVTLTGPANAAKGSLVTYTLQVTNGGHSPPATSPR